jgi:aminopeptidase N
MRYSFVFVCLMVISPLSAYSQMPPFVDNTRLIAAGDAKSFVLEKFSVNKTSSSNIDVIYTRFNWEINPEILYISGDVAMLFKTLDGPVQSIQLELNQTMIIDSIIHQSEKVNWFYQNDFQFVIDLQEPVPPATLDSLTIYYQGVPEEGNGFGSFIKSQHNSIPIIWTLSEPYGAREWWPGKNDLRDKIDSIDVVVTTPVAYRAASHGILVSEISTNEKRVSHWRHRFPIVSYLIAIAVTNYTSFTNYAVLEGDSIPVLEYVFPEDSAAIANQTDNTPEMMQLFDTLFGPYPFATEKYGHAQFARGGGMEHQTMSFMGNYSHDIRAHELAHSWYGNKITLGSWHDIFLNEGFATYSTGLSYENMHEGYYWNIWKTNTRNAILEKPDGSVYVEDTTDVFRIFDARLSYHKGAYLLHTLRWIMGDDNFFTALRNYTSDPDLAYDFATFNDFKYHFEIITGFDLTDFFNSWYYGEGYPIYSIDVGQLAEGEIMITIHQEQSHPSVEYFKLPVPLSLYGQGQKTEIVCQNTYSGEVFLFENPGFIVDSVKFDEDQWIAAKLNTLNLVINEKKIKPSLNISPNPAFNQIQLNASSYQINNVSVFDISGMQVLNFPIENFAEKLFIKIDALSPGTYLLKCSTKDGNYLTGKFIKAAK